MVLINLKKRLLSPQPKIKVLRKPKIYICPWKMGDVFAYQLNGKEAEDHNMLGKQIVIQKVNQADNLKDGLSPVVTIRIVDQDKQPELDALKLPCVRVSRYMGYKWSYRLHIYFYSTRTLFYKSLIYLGNKPLLLASDDYPHENNAGYKSTMPEFFEEVVIDSYLKYGTSET